MIQLAFGEVDSGVVNIGVVGGQLGEEYLWPGGCCSYAYLTDRCYRHHNILCTRITSKARTVKEEVLSEGQDEHEVNLKGQRKGKCICKHSCNGRKNKKQKKKMKEETMKIERGNS